MDHPTKTMACIGISYAFTTKSLLPNVGLVINANPFFSGYRYHLMVPSALVSLDEVDATLTM